MLSTIIVISVYGGLFLASCALWGWFLRLGLRWKKVEQVTVRRLIGATVVNSVLREILGLAILSLTASTMAQATMLTILAQLISVSVSTAIIAKFFHIRSVIAFQAWLCTLFAPVIVLALLWFVVNPLICKSFVIPTNSMAPTLVGRHVRTTCPQCGKFAYSSPRPMDFPSTQPYVLICDNFHVTETLEIDSPTYDGDRLAAIMFWKPRRWDLVIFKLPSDPSVYYVKRLIGLPSETVTIREGAVWVNGEKQTPPESLSGIEYLSEAAEHMRLDLWGTDERPAVLSDDEYFVLGDFSAQAADSRYWQYGAPDHPPYAVPQANMVGVVTHTYWPPQRWRIHR